MAVTFTPTLSKRRIDGDRMELLFTVACSGVPTSGGDALDLSAYLDLDLFSVTVGQLQKSDGTSAVLTSYDPTTTKVSFFVQGTAAAGTAMTVFTGNTNLGGTSQMGVSAIGKGKAAV
jgi:hypothetical protein